MGNSFIDFLKKPMMCKCGHPSKPCHRTGKWYDGSRRCKECDCDEFTRRNASSKLNKGVDVTAISLIGFLCIMFIAGAYSVDIISHTPGLEGQEIKLPTLSVVKMLYLAFMVAALYLGMFCFSWIQNYFKVHRKELKPIDPKWSKEND